jgi:hypothetical protein
MSKFTEEDLEELFLPDVDENFKRDFRQCFCGPHLWQGGGTSKPCDLVCTLECSLSIPKYTLEELETGRITCLSPTDLYNVYARTAKIPYGILAYSRENLNEYFTCFTADQINAKSWKLALEQHGAPFQCVACQSPAISKRGECLKRVKDDETYRVRLHPCFPLCDDNKCELLAGRAISRMYKEASKLPGHEILHIPNTPLHHAQIAIDSRLMMSRTIVVLEMMQGNPLL